MNNNFNGNMNNGNMGENPESNNIGDVNFDRLFDVLEPVVEKAFGGKFVKAIKGLKKSKNPDFNGPQKGALVLLTGFVKPVAERLGLLETLNVSKHLKVENIDSNEAKNILLAISEVIYDLIQDEECFNALLENLPEEQRIFFRENREVLLKLRKEDIRSVVDKLVKMDFFSKVECIFQQIIKGEFKPSVLKLLFWDGENTRGKIGKGLAIAEVVVTGFVAISSCLFYIAFLFLDKYIDKKIDVKRKHRYNCDRRELVGMTKTSTDLAAETQEKMKKLDNSCSSMSSSLTDKLSEGNLKMINRYDIQKAIVSALFGIFCPLFLLKNGIGLFRKIIDKNEEHKFSVVLREEFEKKGYRKNGTHAPLLDDGNVSTFDESLDK